MDEETQNDGAAEGAVEGADATPAADEGNSDGGDE
jgi:hypothetical protein